MAMPTVIFVTVWKGFGYTLTILSAAALGVSESLYEAAEIDGATGLQKFFYVTIPGIRDTIGFCVVTTLIMALQVFDQIYVMTGGGRSTRPRRSWVISTTGDFRQRRMISDMRQQSPFICSA